MGYGGTKTEMERLISDANRVKEANGEMADLSIDSFADIVESIHIIQTEMGIYGTTAAEAGSTIQGSVMSMKAAWSNLVTGIADDNADFDQLTSDFVESVGTAGENLLPRLKTALQGIGKLVSGLAPVISQELPGLVNTVLPELLNSAVMLVDGVIAALPDLLSTLTTALVENMPLIISAVFTLLEGLVAFLSQNAGMLTQGAFDLIFALANGLIESLPTMIPSIVNIILEMVKVLTDPENLSNLLTCGADLILALVDGILDSLPMLLEAAPEIIVNLIFGLVDALPRLLAQGPIILGKLILGIIKALPDLLMLGPRIIMKIADGIFSRAKDLIKSGGEIIQKIKDGIGDAWTALKDVGANLIKGLWNGVKEWFGWIKEKFTSVIDFIKAIFTGEDGFDEHSPSKWSEGVMDYVMQGMVNGVEKAQNSVFKAASEVVDGVKNIFDTPIGEDFGSDLSLNTDMGNIVDMSASAADRMRRVDTMRHHDYGYYGDYNTSAAASAPTTVILQIDKKVFGQVTFDAVRNQKFLIGENAVEAY